MKNESIVGCRFSRLIFFSDIFLIASIPNIAYSHMWYVFLNKALITENYLAMRYKVALEHA